MCQPAAAEESHSAWHPQENKHDRVNHLQLSAD